MIETALSESYLNLLKKYNKPGPRYTSYPTVPEWRSDFSHEEYTAQLRLLQEQKNQSLSLYFHFPFCEERCLYCGCHVIIDKNRRYVEKYIDYLIKEIKLFSSNLDRKPLIGQMHWGGGTPTFLNEVEIQKIYNAISEYFIFEKDAEIAIEVDPCVTTKGQVKLLKDLGFNRMSLGIQDFNPDVQKAVERNQSKAETVELIDYARSIGFNSINLDFIYGLPLQTVESFSETVRDIIQIQPERIALFSYAKIPWLKPHQKRIEDDTLPDVDEKFAIFLNARKILMEEGGYTAIGMDHFAKSNDEIALALKNKTLHRNFMGYTVKSTNHFIGFGVSSIGYINQGYAQNVKTLKEYYEALDQQKLPVERGMLLNKDDLIRQYVIYSLMCQFELNYQRFYDRFQLSFRDYFKEELIHLEDFLEDDFLEMNNEGIRIKEQGTLFIRNIAMEFDRYLKNKQKEKRFSQTV